MSNPLGTVAGVARSITSAIPRIHHGGFLPIAAVAGATVLVRAALHVCGFRRGARTVGRFGFALTVASTLFFREPRRVPPTGSHIVVAPADGVVTAIELAAPPPETGLGSEPRMRISTFLSVLDTHVQFAPVTGRISAVHYHPGQFVSADLDKASEVNERNSLVIQPQTGGDAVVATQIAGLIARRIVCDVRAGDSLSHGQVYGLIRFGSRLDVYLPAGSEVLARIGQRAVGGESILATLPGYGAQA